MVNVAYRGLLDLPVRDGTDGQRGATGPAGPTGPQGNPGATGPAGPGLPVGGTDGQIIYKDGGTDYQTRWDDAPSGGTTPALQGVNVRQAVTTNVSITTDTSGESSWTDLVTLASVTANQAGDISLVCPD